MLKNKGFGELVKDIVADRLGREYEVTEREVTKNNGVILSGLSVTKKDVLIAPTVYLEEMEKEYEKGEIDINQIVKRIIDTVKKESERLSLPNGLGEFINDPEKVYKNCYPRVVNAERNRELLKEVPHDSFLDLAVVYVIRVRDMFQSPGNIMIRNDLAEKVGLTHDMIRKSAFENLKKDGHITQSLSEMIKGMMGDIDIGVSAEELDAPMEIQMFVITNGDKYYGANCILDNEVFVELSDKLGSDLYVLPSSVHEVICIEASDKTDLVELEALVRSVNGTTVSNEEYLSDTVYRFSRHNRKLAIA